MPGYILYFWLYWCTDRRSSGAVLKAWRSSFSWDGNFGLSEISDWNFERGKLSSWRGGRVRERLENGAYFNEDRSLCVQVWDLIRFLGDEFNSVVIWRQGSVVLLHFCWELAKLRHLFEGEWECSDEMEKNVPCKFEMVTFMWCAKKWGNMILF
jgi:hypothetical protein